MEEDYEKRIATLHVENEALEGEVASLRSKLHAVLSGHEPSTVSFKEQVHVIPNIFYLGLGLGLGLGLTGTSHRNLSRKEIHQLTPSFMSHTSAILSEHKFVSMMSA